MISASKVLCSLVVVIVISNTAEAHWGGYFTSCSVEKGLWYNGTTLSVRYAYSLDQCCSRCQANPSCYSYSYSRRREICYQVGYSTQKVYQYRWTSGIVRNPTTSTVASTTNIITITLVPSITPVTLTEAPTTTPTTGCFIETNINYAGFDFNQSIAINYSDCCNLCGITTGCAAWSWNLLTKVCTLKSSVPALGNRLPLTYMFSGVPTLIPPTDVTTTTTLAPTTTTTITTTTVATTTTTTVATTITTTVATTTATTTSGTTKSYGCFVENDYNYLGNDIGSLILPSISECCNACGTSTTCVVWTFQLSNGNCSLKNNLPSLTQRVPMPLFFSGIVTLK